MSGTDDRPQPRVRPRPAPTVDDPARPLVPPAAPAPAAAPAEVLPSARGRRAQPLVQLNTRVPPLLDELVAVVMEKHGVTKRDVIENALRAAYPSEYRALLAREEARKGAS